MTDSKYTKHVPHTYVKDVTDNQFIQQILTKSVLKIHLWVLKIEDCKTVLTTALNHMWHYMWNWQVWSFEQQKTMENQTLHTIDSNKICCVKQRRWQLCSFRQWTACSHLGTNEFWAVSDNCTAEFNWNIFCNNLILINLMCPCRIKGNKAYWPQTFGIFVCLNNAFNNKSTRCTKREFNGFVSLYKKKYTCILCMQMPYYL